jgi:hypothetical protein
VHVEARNIETRLHVVSNVFKCVCYTRGFRSAPNYHHRAEVVSRASNAVYARGSKGKLHRYLTPASKGI